MPQDALLDVLFFPVDLPPLSHDEPLPEPDQELCLFGGTVDAAGFEGESSFAFGATTDAALAAVWGTGLSV